MPDSGETLAELEDEFRQLGAQLSQISARRNELAALIERRKAEATARVKLSGMDPKEREALKRVLNEEF